MLVGDCSTLFLPTVVDFKDSVLTVTILLSAMFVFFVKLPTRHSLVSLACAAITGFGLITPRRIPMYPPIGLVYVASVLCPCNGNLHVLLVWLG